MPRGDARRRRRVGEQEPGLLEGLFLAASAAVGREIALPARTAAYENVREPITRPVVMLRAELKQVMREEADDAAR